MVSRSDCPESTIRKVRGDRFCTSSSNCAPSMPGIRMSVTMMSNVCRSMAARASSPPAAKTISHSARMGRKLRFSPVSTMGSSSTNKIRFAMITLRLPFRRFCKWDANVECSSLSPFRVEPYLSSVASHDGGVGQSQSLSRPFPHRFGREEGLKYPRAHGFWYSHSGVGNGDLDPVLVAHGGDHNLSFTLRTVSHGLPNRLRRIDQEVENHLVELAGVAEHQRQVGSKTRFHVSNILPLIARYCDGGIDRLVDVNGLLCFRSGMRKLLHGTYDLGYPLNAFQGLFDGMGNLRLQVFEVRSLSQGIEPLQRLWRNRPGRGFLLHLSGNAVQGVERGPGFLQESGVITHVLNGSIDFVRNSSSQLPNRLQFLCLPQLLSQNLVLCHI